MREPGRTRYFLRSFLIQGAWNPRDLLGTGLAWVVGREVAGCALDPEAGEPGEGTNHFNAHPFLAGLAIGALRRMHDEGASRDELRRFRMALPGPLGALGDALVWAGWLPAALMVAGAALLLGLPPLGAVLLFLLLHNVPHLALRWWAVGAGLRHGRQVALAFQEVNLSGIGGQVRGLTVLFSGIVLGVSGVLAVGALEDPLGWLFAGVVGVGIGLWRGLGIPVGVPAGVALLLLLALGLVPWRP